MRPRRLVSVRANQSKRLSSYLFRGADLLAVAAVTVGLLAARPGPLAELTLSALFPTSVAALVICWVVRALRLYRFVRSESLPAHLGQVVLAAGPAALALFVVDWLMPRTPAATTCLIWLGTAAGTLVVLHAGWWTMVRRWQAAGWLTPNLVIVGATEYAERLISDALTHRHANVVGVFDDRLERVPGAVLGVPVLGDVDSLLTHKITPYVDRIVVAVEPSARERVASIANRLAALPNNVTLFLEQDDSAQRAAALARLADSPLADLSGAPDVDRKAFAKRMQDLVVGIPLLLLATPVLALVAVLIKLDTPGPVFFRQRRHGFNNEEILVWKFRSMRHEVADARAERQVTADDERVTKVGRFLRGTSLDEVPQLINVVRGEMSLVGPRPHAIGMKTGEVESARLVAEYAHRHRIKPGMTGWAAIHGSRGPLHTEDEVQRRVALDIDYIARQSLRLDLAIIARTLPSMLGDRDAIR
ncbi:exopolysaccharide biosynthesis polyprenyl glycosylphosphotransferase [uncultured Jatrophihabitans sp.]|uniref:exopolysaccharide biosynthesis polyprenyl glycosylphosphotransferase n=1 Tax=uncultured Jatrophihabitans sp. TaxID=1610747 RepID=UPI0035CB58B7